LWELRFVIDCEFNEGGRAMPIYFFAANDERPDQLTGEDLPHNRAACEWAARVTREVNRNRRRPQTIVRVSAYRSDGSLVE
jgi:hypothetical protein